MFLLLESGVAGAGGQPWVCPAGGGMSAAGLRGDRAAHGGTVHVWGRLGPWRAGRVSREEGLHPSPEVFLGQGVQ